ncbi:MAG TPA: alanine racemase [Novimethylophilus sp.]|jgi:alanine racemase|uniref:alanine racemase n=1 Tax=Novimethylophilus sp. TaxID=2137426 RepID=UPI002F4095F2
MRPIRATIHTDALRHNLALAKSQAPNSKIMAVIKADGYGHGMLRVARALADAEGFAVLRVEEGVALREAGFKQTILLLEGLFSADELPVAAAHGLSLVVHCEEQLHMLEAAPIARPVSVFIKLNTGMHRLGLPLARFWAVYDRLKASKAVCEMALMTHFATADDVYGIDEQLSRFNSLTQEMRLPKSLANSAALLRYPQTHTEWVRPGIMLYGATPFADQGAAGIGLKPAMTLSSQIIAVQNLSPSDAVGYGRLFVADKPARVGVVACGYADGYPRHAPNGTPILVAGKRTRTVGRVSMDMLYVDITDIPEADIGSPVELWGENIPVDDVALAAGTVGYELLCAVAPRVPVAED